MRARTSLADTWSKAPLSSSLVNELKQALRRAVIAGTGGYQEIELLEHLEESSGTPVIPVRNSFGGVAAA